MKRAEIVAMQLKERCNNTFPADTADGVLDDISTYKREIYARAVVDTLEFDVFSQLDKLNVHRCESHEGFNQPLTKWSNAEWGCAIAGEVGEMCNLLKKQMRNLTSEDKTIDDVEIADEMADAIIYIHLLATKMNIDLPQAIVNKFNMVSGKIGYKLKLK